MNEVQTWLTCWRTLVTNENWFPPLPSSRHSVLSPPHTPLTSLHPFLLSATFLSLVPPNCLFHSRVHSLSPSLPAYLPSHTFHYLTVLFNRVLLFLLLFLPFRQMWPNFSFTFPLYLLCVLYTLRRLVFCPGVFFSLNNKCW